MNKQGIFLRAMAAESTEAEIDIVGVIGWEVWYDQMKTMLAAIPETAKRVTFNIYSPGGDVWEGNGIVQAIGELSKRCETVAKVQMAASMATLIAVACDHRSIARNGRFLIHNAWAGVQGDAAEMEKMAKSLRDCEQEAAKFYAERAGGTAEDMLALMAEERWMMPEETKALGFVQDIDDPFAPSEFAAVREEIVAAGKWPSSLAELPADEEPSILVPPPIPEPETIIEESAEDEVEPEPVIESEESDGTETDSGAEDKEAEADAEHPQPEVEVAAQADYQRGIIHGVLQGRNESALELADKVDAMKAKITALEKLAREQQSRADKAEAKVVAIEKAADERCDKLSEQLDAATRRLSKFVDAAAAFSPAVMTWGEALAACDGDYAKAAKQYPELRDRYNMENSHK